MTLKTKATTCLILNQAAFLPAILNKPARPEPKNQIAAGNGTALMLVGVPAVDVKKERSTRGRKVKAKRSRTHITWSYRPGCERKLEDHIRSTVGIGVDRRREILASPASTDPSSQIAGGSGTGAVP